MSFRRLILFCAGLLLGSSPAWTAPESVTGIPLSSAWQYRAWQADEGLPDNNVTGVAQTSDGFVWVATFGGLMRFNGTRFEEFSVMHLEDVPNRVVRLMFLDSEGKFWLAMDRGPLVCVDRTSARVFTSQDGLLDTRAVALAGDGAGGAWVAYADDILHVAKDKVSRLTSLAGVPAGGANWVANDAQGAAWLVRGSQAGALRDGRWQSEWLFDRGPVRLCAARTSGLWATAGTVLCRAEVGRPPAPLAQLPTNVVVQALLEDQAGAVWIGTLSHGLFRWKDGQLHKTPTANSQIACLFEDREGNIWAGTAAGGLNRLRWRTVDVIGTADGLPFESLRSICEDAKGGRWAVADNGLLLHYAEGRWDLADERVGWRGGVVNCVTADQQGGVWIGMASSELARLQDGQRQQWRRDQGLAGNYVRSLLAASNGDLWVATGSPSRLHRVREGTLQPLETTGDFRSIRAMAETADGTIWAGTSEGHLLRISPETLKIENLTPDQRLLSIRFLQGTEDGSLWIGYAGWGVGRWKDGRHVRITAAQGLYDDYVSQILADDRGELWMNSNHGLFTAKVQDLIAVAENRASRIRCNVYGREAGLPSLQPRCDYFPSAWRLQDGSLSYALRNGLAVVQPKNIRPNPEPPPVVVERVTVDNATVARFNPAFPLFPQGESRTALVRPVDGLLRVPPRHQRLEFQFAALSYSSPENVQFRYQLKNFDDDWTVSGPISVARYPRLSAGQYEFQVQACNEAGVWNEAGFRLQLAVMPFFWQTWWFRLALLAGFTAGIVGLVRFFSFRRLQRQLARLEQQAALHRERTRIARDMHDEVGAKLSRLSLLSEMASHQPDMPPAARGEVAEISETARDTIRSFEEVVWAVNPQNDSLANLVHYVCRFAEDFFEGSPTQCVFEVPDEIPSVELSTELRHHVFLGAKEALNNALKHARARQVCVRLLLAPESFALVIEDNGAGFGPEAKPSRPGTGNGLANMRERMKAVGGELNIQSRPGKGSCVTFRVPIARAAT